MTILSHGMQLLDAYLRDLLKFAGYRSLHATLLLLLSTLLQGFSLLLLIPGNPFSHKRVDPGIIFEATAGQSHLPRYSGSRQAGI